MRNSVSVHNAYIRRWALSYAQTTAYWGSKPSSLVDHFPVFADVNRGRALDLGCGQGRNVRALLAKNYHVTAVDLLREAISEMDRQRIQGVSLVCADVLNFLPSIASSSIDVVLCNHVIQHLSETDVHDVLLPEIQRVLQPSGIAALAYFTAPRGIHPEYVRDWAYLPERGEIAGKLNFLEGAQVRHLSASLRLDMHGGHVHFHAIERLVFGSNKEIQMGNRKCRTPDIAA